MAKCPYCGKSAGIFRKKHYDCERRYFDGIAEIKQKLKSFFVGDKTTKEQLVSIAQGNFIDKEKLNELFEVVYSYSIDQMLDDGLLSENEETTLAEFQEYYGIDQDVLNKNKALNKVVGASILRDLFAGKKITGRFKIDSLPFKFMKGEELIFFHSPVLLSEQRIKTEYEGGSSGISIRIAQGLYYRTSGFKGRPIKNEVMTPVDYGMMALTNKHLYFSSNKKSFRIRYDRIVSLDSYSDGIGIHKDGVSAKPMIFSEVDGWFCFNFIKNIESFEDGSINKS